MTKNVFLFLILQYFPYSLPVKVKLSSFSFNSWQSKQAKPSLKNARTFQQHMYLQQWRKSYNWLQLKCCKKVHLASNFSHSFQEWNQSQDGSDGKIRSTFFIAFSVAVMVFPWALLAISVLERLSVCVSACVVFAWKKKGNLHIKTLLCYYIFVKPVVIQMYHICKGLSHGLMPPSIHGPRSKRIFRADRVPHLLMGKFNTRMKFSFL